MKKEGHVLVGKSDKRKGGPMTVPSNDLTLPSPLERVGNGRKQKVSHGEQRQVRESDPLGTMSVWERSVGPASGEGKER